jgi:hypothetical protein
MTEERSLYKRVTASGIIRTGAGVLRIVNIAGTDSAATGGSVEIYDGTDDTGTLLHSEYVAAAALPNRPIDFDDVQVTTGIYVKIITSADVAVGVAYL